MFYKSPGMDQNIGILVTYFNTYLIISDRVLAPRRVI